MARGTNLEHTRAYNRRAVFEMIRVGGPISRAEVARQTSLTLQSVSNLVGDLIGKGLILDQGRQIIKRGQPPVLYTLNPEGAFSIGVSLERDHITAALMNLAGETLARTRLMITEVQPADAVEHIGEFVPELLSNLSREQQSRFLGVGVALPGIISETQGEVLRMAGLPTWEGFPVKDALQARLGLPIHVANDAIMAALGERWYGQGRSFNKFFFVLITRGFGSSLILNGEPYGGIWGITGRLSHIPVEPNGKFCHACGETGCLSLYTSLNALLEELSQHDTQICNVEELSKLYTEEHPVLLAWLDAAARRVARGLVTLENLLDPEAIIFGGRMPDVLLDHLLEGVMAQYERRRMHFKVHQPALIRSARGEDAVVLGAATLPIYLTLAPDFDLILK